MDRVGRTVDQGGQVADGRSNKWIGDRLSLPSVTVKKTLAGIARKFGHGAREELVAIALRAGIID